MTDKIVVSLLVNTAVFSVLFFVLLLIRKAAGKRMSPVLMLAMWAVLAVKLVIPFGFESSISIMPPVAIAGNAPNGYVQPADNMPNALPETENNITAIGTNTAAETVQTEKNSPASVNGQNAGHEAVPAIGWPVIALCIWGAGAIFAASGLCLSAANIKRRIKHASIDTPQHILELTAECKEMLGISRDVSVITQSAIGKPLITGAVRPVLILPENSVRFETEALRHVLLHELTHLKRGDLWTIRILNILGVLYWFNPLVRLYFKLIREDIEIACDQCVIKTLGTSQRLSYIRTVLQFAQCETTKNRLAAAMGLFDGRPAFERRIKRMYGNTKTGIKGRIIAAFIALAVFAVSALTACQPAANIMPRRVEDKWQFSKQYDSGSSLNVDAKVFSVEAKTLPMLTVVPKAFENGEKLKSITKLFCPDAKIYYTAQGEDDSNSIVITSDLADDIDASLDGVVTYYTTTGDDASLNNVTFVTDQGEGTSLNGVVTYSVQGDDITLNTVASPDDPKESYYLTVANDGSSQANMVAISDNLVSYIDFVNWDIKFEKQDSSKGSAFYYESDLFNSGNSETRDVLVTPESLSGDGDYLKAKERADGYVKGMGIDYMTLNSVSRGEGSYSFYYTRTYKGLPETYVQTHKGTTVTGVDGAPTISLWGSEYLSIEIQNGNVVKASWENPSEIKSADNGNSKMLPWEEVKQIFLNEMDDMMTPKSLEAAAEMNAYVFREGTEVVINRVELGYTKLLTEGTNDDYKLVPTWMFMGYEKDVANALHKGANTGAMMCFVTINALDGTIIDRGQGS